MEAGLKTTDLFAVKKTIASDGSSPVCYLVCLFCFAWTLKDLFCCLGASKQKLEIFSVYLPNSPFKAFKLQTMTSLDYLSSIIIGACKEAVDGQSSKDPLFFLCGGWDTSLVALLCHSYRTPDQVFLRICIWLNVSKELFLWEYFW